MILSRCALLVLVEESCTLQPVLAHMLRAQALHAACLRFYFEPAWMRLYMDHSATCSFWLVPLA